MSTRSLGLSLWLISMVTGCGGSAGMHDDGGSPPPVVVPHNFQEIDSVILQKSCAGFSVCHSARGAAAANRLDLSADPYAALVGVAAVNAKAASENMARVQPCDPDRSLLVIKLELPTTATDPNAGYGVHMPQSSPSLAPAQVQAIRDWIARGAPRDESGTVAQGGCAR
jgi:hypothetical protein